MDGIEASNTNKVHMELFPQAKHLAEQKMQKGIENVKQTAK